MQQYRKNLGKVSLTAEGAWNLNNSYDILSIVYDEHTQHGFISRKAVPQGVDLYNKEYWMPLNVSGYADNNVIILSKKTSEASIQSYTLEEAIASIKSVGRRPGAILGFYNENNDRLDIGGRWELWQFNDTNVYNWENVDSWQNLYYNYNKFMGWFKDENFLTKYAPFPEIGCYAFVGSEFNEATVYRCDNKYVWNNTTQHAWDYVRIIVDGNVTVGENGNWFNNGEDTGIPASVKGENGKTPVFREKDNTIQYSFDNVNWITISDKVAAWFRWNATTGDTQANNVGRIQISRDNVTWTNLSGDIINNLHISRYIGADETLPTSGIAEGTICAKGPYYAEDDTLNDNPIYRLWVYAWKGNTLAWQDNGEFTSIAAGVVQETGDSETEVMSQKAVSTKLSELGQEVAKFSNGSELIIKKIISSSSGVTNWINSFKQGVNYTFNVKFSNAVKVFAVTNINTGVDEIKYSGEPITEKNFVVDWKTTCPSVNVYVVTQNGESVNIDIQLLYKGDYDNVKDNAAAIARHENDINQNSINIKKNLVDVEKIKNGNNLVLKSFKSASGGTITWNNDFKKNEYYIFHISTDNPIKLFIVTNVNTGVNEIEYNGEPITEKDFVVNWKENCSSVIFYIKTEDGGTADVEVQLYNKRDYDNVKDNAVAIEKTDKEVEIINKALGFKLFETEYNGLITTGSVLKFADYTFKYKETYLFQFECDDVVSVSFLKLHNINNADNGVSVKGKLNGESLLLTMDSDSKGVYVYSTLNEIFKCRIKVYRVTDLSQSDKTIYRTKNISIPSSQSVVTMQVINGLAPYLIKGLEYHISIELDSDVPINNGYFDVSWDDTYNGSSTQSIHITDYTSNLNGLDIAFIPLHNMAEVNMTLWLNALANDVNGKAYIYQKRNYVSVIDKMKYRSNVSAFLASYTISGEPGNLRLAISQDGLHFRKLSENAIFESGIGDGFQHDIAISKKDGYFYIIATTNVSDGLNAVFSLFRSKNLFQWEQCEDIKIPLSSFNYDEGNSYKSAWAPEILYLYGKYYFSFAICEKWTGSASGSILKAYIGELNDNFTSVSNIERISLNKDHADFAFDITIFHDTETNILYAYEHDGGVYRSKTGDFSEWTPVGCIPLTDYGYAYMEGGTILKVDGWFYIYGDGTIANSGKANNMLCWRTKDFTQYELVDKQFDKDIRHPKVITLDMLDTAIVQKVFIDNLFV